MSDEAPAGFEEPLLETRQGPVLDGHGENESAQEIAEVVGDHPEEQPHLIGPEPVTGEAGPVGGGLALLDPLLGRPALVVEAGARTRLLRQAPRRPPKKPISGLGRDRLGREGGHRRTSVRYQSRICSPVQKTTPSWRRMWARAVSSRPMRWGTPIRYGWSAIGMMRALLNPSV